MAVPHDTTAEAGSWDIYAKSVQADLLEPRFGWTQYRGHGPGAELLGSPQRVLEIGCGTGRALAYLAHQGIEARGVDISPVMVKKASDRWAGTGATFECGEVLEWLAGREDNYDAIYSVFGAAWCTDPRKLFPLVRSRLRPGGRFVFSQPPAIPGAYGPQGTYTGCFTGKALFTYRYSYRPAVWERLLTRAGYASAEATLLTAPAEGHIGTLLVRAEI